MGPENQQFWDVYLIAQNSYIVKQILRKTMILYYKILVSTSSTTWITIIDFSESNFVLQRHAISCRSDWNIPRQQQGL